MNLHQVAPQAPQLFYPSVGRTWRGYPTQQQADTYEFGWVNHHNVLHSLEFDVRGPAMCGAFDRESHEEVSREHAEAVDDMAEWASSHAGDCGRRL